MAKQFLGSSKSTSTPFLLFHSLAVYLLRQRPDTSSEEHSSDDNSDGETESDESDREQLVDSSAEPTPKSHKCH